MPLRLFRSPSTAVRSATGVVPGGNWSADGRTGSGSSCSGAPALLAASSSPPPHADNASAAASAAGQSHEPRMVTQSGVQA
jgi:hypothetical protein